MPTEPSLRELLVQFCREAASYNGVTGPTARALYATIEESERLLKAARRLLAELYEDGLTEEALAFARDALAIPRQNHDPLPDSPPGESTTLLTEPNVSSQTRAVSALNFLREVCETQGAPALQPQIAQAGALLANALLQQETPGPNLAEQANVVNLWYLAGQVRLLRDLQNQAEREGAVADSNIAKAAQGSGQLLDALLYQILGPRDTVPTTP